MMRSLARLLDGRCRPVAIFIAAVLATGSHAADRFWTNIAGGVFGDPSNWDGGVSIPGIFDDVTFDLTATYTVEMHVDRASDRLVVRQGSVALDLADAVQYDLGSTSPLDPSIAVGAHAGDDARLDVVGGTLLGGHARIGTGDAALGALSIVGSGAHLDVLQLQVGRDGIGSFTLSGGSSAVSATATIGGLGTGSGSATIEGAGSAWTIDTTLRVGQFSSGDLLVRDGAHIVSGSAIIGLFDEVVGSAVVSDGATWTINGRLDVGQRGVGTLHVESDSTVSTQGLLVLGAAGPIPQKMLDGGAGHLFLDGADTLLHVGHGQSRGDLYLGQVGAGALTAGRGARVLVDGHVYEGTTPTGAVPVRIELGHGADYPQAAISVGGDFFPANVTVDLVDGFAPASGDVFELVSRTNAVFQPTPTSVTLPPLPAGLNWTIAADEQRLAVGAFSGECTPALEEADCDDNGVTDACEIASGFQVDCDDNGIPDACEADCNANGRVDACDIAAGFGTDCNLNGILDACEMTSTPFQLPPPPPGTASFGASVAIEADVLVTGAPQHVEAAGAVGAAYVFRRMNGRWSPETLLLDVEGTDGDEFGRDVAVNGDTIVVSAPGEASPAGGTGSASVFRWSNNQWTFEQKLRASDDGEALRFGEQLAVSGNVIICGAFSPAGEGSVEKAYIFRRAEGGPWIEERVISVNGPGALAPNVTVDGDMVAIATRSADRIVQIHRYDGAAWQLEKQLFFGSGFFALPIQLAGDLLFASGVAIDPSQTHVQTGVLVYRRGALNWHLETVLAPVAQSIRSISVDRDTLAVRDNDSAGIVRWDGATWSEIAVLPAPTTSGLGLDTVDVSGDQVAVSGTSGVVQIYDLQTAGCNDCPDLDGNGTVGFSDLLTIITGWGPCNDCPQDLDGNGTVDFSDLIVVILAWGEC